MASLTNNIGNNIQEFATFYQLQQQVRTTELSSYHQLMDTY